MILIDDRTGSKELQPLFSNFGIDTQLAHLEYGDCYFTGCGPSGNALVGVERKRIGDLVNSIRTGRFAGYQLQGMLDTYDFSYLLVEGMYKPGQGGALEVWRGGKFRPLFTGTQGVQYKEIESFLNSMAQFTGIEIKRSSTDTESAHILSSLYHWWQKPWTAHHSHQEIYAPLPRARKMSFVSPEQQVRTKYGEGRVVVMKVAAQLPRIDSKAIQVAERFTSVVEMACATVDDWMEIDGVGTKTANRIVEVLNGSRS